MEQFDSESYWHRSTSKAFNFDDDGDDVCKEFGATASVLLSDDAISEASFDNSVASSAVGISVNALIGEENLKQLLQEQTLDDRIVTKGVSAEEELKLLRRHIQTTLYSPSAAATAYKLLLGKLVPLEAFKSLHEKKQLLDAVLDNGNAGDAVISVLLFLKKTLKSSLFHNVLQERPNALTQYISYLKRIQPNEAIELLQIFNKHHEAALMQFQAAILSNTLPVRKQKLHQLIQHYSNDVNVVPLYQQLFQASYKLLELIEKEHNNLDNRVQVNSTPIEVLHACCQKYSNWKEQDMIKSISPYRCASEQQISSAQFEWTALNERANAQAYADLEFIFERTPTWNPMKQKQFHISFSLEAAIMRLYHLQAPDPVLYFFLTKMNNNSDKLAVAKRVKCTKAIIDALASVKDVPQLVQLKETLAERSEEHFYCDRILKNLQTKRWSTDSIKLKL